MYSRWVGLYKVLQHQPQIRAEDLVTTHKVRYHSRVESENRSEGCLRPGDTVRLPLLKVNDYHSKL